MDLNDYFEPISLDRSDDTPALTDTAFGRSIRINTASNPIDEISDYHIAIFGIQEERNSLNKGSAASPDAIRRKLYALSRVNERLKIIDLGNIKQTAKLEDAFYGVRDVMIDLLNNQVTAIVLGGTQDITVALFNAFELKTNKVNVVSIDSRIDMDKIPTGSFNWNNALVDSPNLFRYTAMGHQQYLVNSGHIETLEKKGFDALRLGLLHSNMQTAEPYLRDAHLVSFDVSAIKQSDSPGTMYPSPNGFLAEEACLLSRYAGLSDLVSCFGIFEANGKYDHNFQTMHLAAQSVWYFIEGFGQRKKEKPAQNQADFKVFMVNHQDMEHALTFYKSLHTGRWWMEIPDMKSGVQIMVACSQDEYQQACNHEIPEMWWKAFQRIN